MKTSIIVLTYNQLETCTKPCVESIYKYTNIDDFELIIVDNSSTDGTQSYLDQIAKIYPNLIIVKNSKNKGYAAGNNDGLRVASGDNFILLNNDTLVTPGWLNKLIRPLNNPEIGLVGPVTNSAGNEQAIELQGINEANYIEVSSQYTVINDGITFDSTKLGFFCVGFRKEIFKLIGGLDEGFGIGMFEDDDYCSRIKKAGLRLVVVEDCFIYHKGSMSFKNLDAKEYTKIFTRNKKRFYKKHGTPWALADIAISYASKIQEEISQLTTDSDLNHVERVRVRLDGFMKLIEIMRQRESAAQKTGLLVRIKRKYNGFLNRFIKGNYISRLNYIYRAYTKLKNYICKDINKKKAKRDLKNIFVNCKQSKGIIIIPATIDYSYMKQRPQQIAKALADLGYLVIYGTLNCQSDRVSLYQEVTKNLFVVNESYFPLLGANGHGKKVIYYCMWPNNIKHLNYLSYDKLLYDYMDDISLLNLPYEELKKNHFSLIEKADFVTVSASKLYQDIPDNYRYKTLIINNAVDEEFINRVNQSPINNEIVEIKKTYKRVIGYYGAIAKWLDFELVNYVADKMVDCAIVLIGPVFEMEDVVEKVQSSHRNVYFLPEKQYEELPSYLKGFDVCMIPFIISSITKAVSPVKLFEYMTSGHPIVTTNLPECRKYDVVNVACDKEDFVRKIEKQLENPTLNSELIKTAASCNTWQARVCEVINAVESVRNEQK